MPIARKYQIHWDPDNYYHLYNRGAHQKKIFREEDNYLFVLTKIKKYLKELDLAMIAYCLLPNHYHFLVLQKGSSPAGLLPQRVFNSYTKAYNQRYTHSGTLFEGRYNAIHVVQESHLRNLCRYIHANPVKHGIVDSLEQWPYSNYLDWVCSRRGELIDREFIEAYFPDLLDYQLFIDDFLVMQKMSEDLDYLMD